LIGKGQGIHLKPIKFARAFDRTGQNRDFILNPRPEFPDELRSLVLKAGNQSLKIIHPLKDPLIQKYLS
jgi:hypothetical protein